MDKKVLLKRAKGLLAFVIAFVMLFGLPVQIAGEELGFGTTLEVVAYDDSQEQTSGTIFVPSDIGGGAVEDQSGAGGKHEHRLAWELTIEPTETTDGRYDYRCECGHSEGFQPVSFLSVVVKNVLRSIEEAPEGSTVVLENRFLRCITDEMMNALKKRSDVSLEVRFTDQGTSYQFVIPAGNYPAEESEWYGYYYLGSIYGWKE